MFKVIQSVRVHQLFNASINRLKVWQSVVEYSLFKQKKFFWGRLPCSSHLLWVVTGWKILLRSPFWGTAPRPALIFCSWCLENKIIQFLHQYGILPYIMRIRIRICHFKGEFFKWLVLDFRNVCTFLHMKISIPHFFFWSTMNYFTPIPSQTSTPPLSKYLQTLASQLRYV